MLTPSKKFRCLTFIFLVQIATVTTSFAQSLNSEASLADIERSMAANLTWNLKSALSLYYPETKVVIKAHVDLQKIKPYRPLPSLPDALLNREITNLPGLPYVPKKLDQNRAPADDAVRLRDYVRTNRYDIRRIRVHVLLDQSLSATDRSFIQRFVSLAADIQPGRGDQILIESLSFPDRSEMFAEREAATEEAPQPEVPPAVTPPEQAAFNWWPFIFAAGLAVFLLILFLLGMRSIVRNLAASLRQPAAQTLRPMQESEPKQRNERQDKNADQETLMRLKSTTIDAIVGTPSVAAKVFLEWIEQKDQTGIDESAMTIAGVSKPLIDLLAPYLGSETTHKLHQSMDALDESALNGKLEPLLRKFDADLRTLALEARKRAGEDDALAFLNQMSDDQLQHLLKSLKKGVQAIVLAQLRPRRAAQLLSKFDPEERKSVLAAIGNIENIPLDVYQHIARQLAARAAELAKMRHVRANGVDALVEVMDHMDEKMQDETLSHLRTQNMQLANKVTKQFMTFNQLFDMPKDKIRELALETDRETLAKSLVQVDRQAVERIIRALPERLGELVRASMESHYHLSQDEISQARRSLMRSLRSKKLQT